MTDQRPKRRRRRLWLSAPALASALLVSPAAAQMGGGTGRGRPNTPPPSDGQYYPRDDLEVAPKVIFFPPIPPPLDRPINHLTLTAPRRLTPPPELAAYVNEPFYAPLSTWLAEQNLGENMRQRLDDYRTAKLTLQRELHTVLDQTRDVEPAARRAALETLARRQAPRLAELEQSAEQLRADLATGSYDWRALREWSLGENNLRGDSPFEIAAVMRAYAYYQNNLTAAQRRLLREISMELAMAAEDEASAQAAQPFLFFPPEPARVLLPDDLPGDLAAKVAVYQTKKSALKKELYDTVYKQDGATFAFRRQGVLRALAEKQTARIAELETLAEDIRRGLAPVVPTVHAAVERSPLPVALTDHIGTLLQARIALQKETIAKVEAIRDRNTGVPAQVSYGFENDSLKFIVVPRRVPGGGMTDGMKGQISALDAAMTAVAEDYGRRFAELVNETEAIRDEAKQALGTADPRKLEDAITAATRVAALRETEDGYRDYRIAVFEPGLSPEQRRLLFDAAIEKLDLPLARGELQPTRRAASW